MSVQASVPFALESVTGSGSFSGYASVFDLVDSDRDRVLRGAFASVITSGKIIPLLWQHHSEQPIGRLTTLREDERGLYVEGKLELAVQAAAEAYALLKAGAISGLSIGYRAKDFVRDTSTGVRDLLDIELLEVSLVTFPANEAATIGQVKSIRELEQFYRARGESRSVAKKHAGQHWPEVRAWQALDVALERGVGVLLEV